MTTEYLGRAQVLVEDLALAGRRVSSDEQNLYVFRGLRPEFKAIVSSLATKGSPVTLGQLSNYLTAQQFIYGDDFAADVVGPVAMMVRQGGARGSFGFSFGRGGRSADYSRRGGSGRGQRGARGRGNRGGCGFSPRCQVCSAVGHTAVSCFSRYADAPVPQAHMTYSDGLSDAPFSEQWFSDTGATHHATPDPVTVSGLEEYAGPDTLHVGNGAGLPIFGVGHASISFGSRSLFLRNVLHVPALTNSLLSVHRFVVDNNVVFEFHPSFFLVKDCVTRKVLLKGRSVGGLYSLSRQGPVGLLSSKASSQIWHDRLGHPHARVLSRILKLCSVEKSSLLGSGQMCPACQLGKSAHFALPRVDKSSARILDLIYTDIWGPSPVLYSEGFRYFVIFVDDCSHYTWLFPMKLKYDIYSIFDRFRALVERQFSTTIKSIQTDLGGEYQKLGRFFAKLGIHHCQSCAYTHV